MESGAYSYSVYPPGNIQPSRPPLRRSAPEEAKSGFPFLVALAGLVLAVGVGAVAKFSPQDLRFEGGKTRTAKAATTSTTAAAVAPPVLPASTAPVIAPTTFTTVGDPSPATMPAPASPNKKVVPNRRLPASRGSTSPATSASVDSSLPDNPYAAPASPETYGF